MENKTELKTIYKVNTAYALIEAAYYIILDAEKELNQIGYGYHREKKMAVKQAADNAVRSRRQCREILRLSDILKDESKDIHDNTTGMFYDFSLTLSRILAYDTDGNIQDKKVNQIKAYLNKYKKIE